MHEEQICFKKHICEICSYVKRGQHVCMGEKYCKNCSRVVKMDHKCFILTVDQKEKMREQRMSKKSKEKDEKEEGEEKDEEKNKIVKKIKQFNGFVFFDFECYPDEHTGEHVVNLAMAQKVSKECIDVYPDCTCEDCTTKIIYYNISDFVDWMLSQSNDHCIFIAHNSKGYDAYMIISELQKRKIPTDANIAATVNGTKVMYFKFRKIEIKDSSLFIPMRLEQFSKAFGIKELKKGFLFF